MPDPRIFPIGSSDDYNAWASGVSAIVVAANIHRVDIEIVNDSDVVVYLSRSDPAAIGDGIRLNANGGSYSMDTQNLWEGAFWAICGEQEEANLTISEGSRE